MAVHLREYQNIAVQNIRTAMAVHRRVLFVLVTGGGKTVIFCYISESAFRRGKRVLIVAHRSEIIDQISRSLANFNVPHGRIQPGYTATADLVQVGMIQTVARRMDKLPAPDLIIIDEAHHGVTPQYVALMEGYSRARILGVTATPERLDGQGLGAIFEEMILGPSCRELIAAGFLADFDYYAPENKIDLSGVKTKMGDYDQSALSEAMDKPTITGDAVAHYRKYLDGKPSLVFCATVAHAEHVAETFRINGYPAASIDGSMAPFERATCVAGLKNGSIKILTSCELISEGFDVPAVAGAVLLRPTKSLSMHLQQCGRALRLKEDGSSAVILDHVGNINRFGTPKALRNWSLDSKKRKTSESGVRQCKLCFKAFEKDETYSCANIGDEDCLFAPASIKNTAIGEGRTVEYVPGELAAITESPPWAGGINILRASGDEFRAMMQRADTYEKLREIQRARGYKIAWVYGTMKRNGINA